VTPVARRQPYLDGCVGAVGLCDGAQKPFIYSLKHNETLWQGFRLTVATKLTEQRLALMPPDLATACR
jgi:hypothetical protein